MKKNYFEKISERWIYLLLAGAAMLPWILYLNLPVFGDDYTWMLYAKEHQGKPIWEIFTVAGPFGYFRPVAVLLINTIYGLFGETYFIYRGIAMMIQVGITVMLYKVLRKMEYERMVSLWTAVMFSMLGAHAEVIYMINCINILAADLFMLCGIYYFISNEKRGAMTLTIMFLSLSMFTRESSLFYIVLLPVVYFYFRLIVRRGAAAEIGKGEVGKAEVGSGTRLAVILMIPVIIYFGVRLNFYGFTKEMFLDGRYELFLNVFKMIYKVFHFVFIAIVPVKAVFYIFGFEFYDSLRGAISRNVNWVVFVIMFLAVGGSAVVLGYSMLKRLGKRVVLPLLLFLSSVVIYLPTENVAERFVYFGSAWVILLVVMYMRELKSKRAGAIVLGIIAGVHFITLVMRGGSYEEYSERYIYSLGTLERVTSEAGHRGHILIENQPTAFKGQMLVSRDNLNDAFRYLYGERGVRFHFVNNMEWWEYDFEFTGRIYFDAKLYEYSLTGETIKPEK